MWFVNIVLPHAAVCLSINWWYYTRSSAIVQPPLKKFFTARRVCIARSMPWQDVRMSVRHTPVFCLNGYTCMYPQSVFTIGRSTILVFPHQTGWQYSNGDPLKGASNAWGVWKNHDFRPICRLTSELMQDRAIVTMEGEQETTLKFSSGTNFNDLVEWPLNQISRSRYYSTSNNSKNGKR